MDDHFAELILDIEDEERSHTWELRMKEIPSDELEEELRRRERRGEWINPWKQHRRS